MSGRTADRAAVPHVVSMLDEHPDRAADALARLPAADVAVPALERQLAGNVSQHVALRIAHALASMGSKLPMVVDVLKAQLGSEEALRLARMGYCTHDVARVLLRERLNVIRALRRLHGQRVRYECSDVDGRATPLAARFLDVHVALHRLQGSMNLPLDSPTFAELTREALDALQKLQPFILGPSAPGIWVGMPTPYTGYEVQEAMVVLTKQAR